MTGTGADLDITTSREKKKRPKRTLNYRFLSYRCSMTMGLTAGMIKGNA
jgi:hypothetical protein